MTTKGVQVGRVQTHIDLSDELLVRLADALIEKTISIGEAMLRIGVNPDDYDFDKIENELLVYIERCRKCRTWLSTFLLIGADDDNPGYCDDCRGDNFPYSTEVLAD